MKTFILLLICLTATVFASAQNVPPYTLSEVEIIHPKLIAESPVNGSTSQSINNYIAKHFIYPDVSGLPHEGTEVIQFIVNPKGELSDIKIINSVSSEVDKEIVRILQKTNKKWMPGKNNGQYVAMEKEIAVEVKVGASENNSASRDFSEIAKEHYRKGAEKLFTRHKTRQALHQFEDAIRYMPYDKSVLTMLAISKMELGKTEVAEQYLSRIQELGGLDIDQFALIEKLSSPLKKSYLELTDQMARR